MCLFPVFSQMYQVHRKQLGQQMRCMVCSSDVFLQATVPNKECAWYITSIILTSYNHIIHWALYLCGLCINIKCNKPKNNYNGTNRYATVVRIIVKTYLARVIDFPLAIAKIQCNVSHNALRHHISKSLTMGQAVIVVLATQSLLDDINNVTAIRPILFSLASHCSWSCGRRLAPWGASI